MRSRQINRIFAHLQTILEFWTNLSKMCTRQQCIDRLTGATPFIQSNFGVTSLSVFGSVARGDNHENSDVDVLVEMPPKAFKMVELKEYLESLLGVAVDLVRRHKNLSPFFLKEIEKDAISIFAQ